MSGSPRSAQGATSRTRVIAWEDQRPLARHEELDGMEVLRRIASGELPRPAVESLLGWDDVREFEEGRVLVTFLPEEHHYSPLGIVHGGVAVSLLDTTTLLSAQSILGEGESCLTIQLKVSFARVIIRDVGRVRCEASVVQRAGGLVETTGSITDESGKEYGYGTSICRVTHT